MPAAGIILAIRLVDLMVAGGTYAMQARASRDRLKAALETQDPAVIAAEISAVEVEVNQQLAELGKHISKPPPRPDA